MTDSCGIGRSGLLQNSSESVFCRPKTQARAQFVEVPIPTCTLCTTFPMDCVASCSLFVALPTFSRSRMPPKLERERCCLSKTRARASFSRPPIAICDVSRTPDSYSHGIYRISDWSCGIELTISLDSNCFWAILNYWRYLGPSGAYLGLSGAIWDYLWLSGAVWGHLGPYLGPSGAYLRPLGCFWFHLGLYGYI